MDTPIRVVVVDDSALARQLIVRMLAHDPQITVVGTATNGRDAVELVRRVRPDVVTMDVRMPGMDGVAATEQLMAYCPTPILVVTSTVDSDEVGITFRMLQAGALEVVAKPNGALPGALDRAAIELTRRVRMLARVRVVTHLRGRRRTPTGTLRMPAAPAPTVSVGFPIVVIGASTGGPRVVHRLLAELPADFGAAVILVQHIAAGFGSVMADWLATAGALPVQLVKDGAVIHPGRALVVPEQSDIEVQNSGKIAVRSAHSTIASPSIDAAMLSAAKFGSRTIGVLLTGMGRDGANGLSAIRRGGGHTIAQDEATSAIFGMPRAAIELGAAVEVLPADHIAQRLIALCGRRGPQ